MLPIYKKLLSFLGIFLVVWLIGTYLLPLFFPFLLGLGLAFTAEPMVRFLNKYAKIPRFFSTFAGVSVTFSFLSLLVILFCAILFRQIRYLASILPNMEQTALSAMALLKNWLLDVTDLAPEGIRAVLHQSITDFFSGGTALVNRMVRWGLSSAGSLLTHVPDSALTLGTAVLSGYMISLKLPRIRRWFSRCLSVQRRQQIRNALNRIRHTLAAWLAAQCKLIGFTLLILSGGFLLLRIPYALLWALGVCLVDAFPVLGTGTILLPWALVCLIQGDTPRAVGLAGIYATISLTRSILEPKLVGRQLGLDPLVTLIALYIGYKLWGIGGMLLAPIITVMILQLAPEKGKEDKL